MKTEVTFDNDNWLNVSLTAETSEEAARLVQHALNRNSSAEEVSRVSASDGKVSAWITLKTRHGNDGEWLRHSSIPKVK